MTRTIEEYNKVMFLFKQGMNKLQIAKQTGVPRGTITDWTLNKINLTISKQRIELDPKIILSTPEKIDAYIYLLGSYLGDGCITQPPSHRTAKLRISCDNKQPFVIQTNVEAMKVLFENNDISIQQRKDKNCSDVGIYSTTLYYLFPQAVKGRGNKNTRNVSLIDWQLNLLQNREGLFLKGLFHSDGSFYKASKKYYRYQFTNTSIDIINIIRKCLSKLDINYCLTENLPLPRSIAGGKEIKSFKLKYNILIQSKSEVKKLYKHCGTKYNEIIQEL